MRPSVGRPMSCATLLRPPSAPMRYLARISALFAGDPVPHRGRHAVLVLLEREVLGVEARFRPARGGMAEQDRLKEILRDVADLGRARQRVVSLAPGMVAPGLDPAELLPGQALAEHGVGHELLWCGQPHGLVLKLQVAQDLHGPLVRDVRPGRVGEPAELRHQDVGDPVGAQQQSAGGARRATADDQHIGLKHRVILPGPPIFIHAGPSGLLRRCRPYPAFAAAASARSRS